MGILRTGVDLFVTYKILRKLTTPFTKTEAYKLGVIDRNGYFLLKKSEMSNTQFRSYTILDKLIWKVKRLLGKIPGGNTAFASYAAALYLLLGEEQKHTLSDSELVLGIVESMDDASEIRRFNESVLAKAESLESGIDANYLIRSWGVAPVAAENILQSLVVMGELINENGKYKRVSEITNTSGSGAVAGLGVGAQGDPGRHSSSFDFGGHKVFVVTPDIFSRVRLGKKKYDRYAKYVGVDDLGEEIRAYGRTNPNRPIILMDSTTGCMTYFKYPKRV